MTPYYSLMQIMTIDLSDPPLFSPPLDTSAVGEADIAAGRSIVVGADIFFEKFNTLSLISFFNGVYPPRSIDRCALFTY
jgi:hypothetical protein